MKIKKQKIVKFKDKEFRGYKDVPLKTKKLKKIRVR